MKTITERFFNAMENQLSEITSNGESPIEQYRLSIRICKKAMSKLKSYVASYAFESLGEEIHFFKEVKPKFYSKYIYYINVYNFLTQKPTGGENIQTDYIKMHLFELKTFFDHNRAFYSYYRSGMTQLDESYYTRGGFDVHGDSDELDHYVPEQTDHLFRAKLTT